MNGLLSASSGVLAAMNLFALVFVAATIGETYNKGFIYELVASTVCIVTTLVNVRILVLLESLGFIGLALLIQIGILTTCILAIKMILKDDYKRNVKPNLQIKL